MRDVRIQRKHFRRAKARRKRYDASGRPPRFAVILHGDWINSCAYMVRLLQRIFFYSHSKAWSLVLLARCIGRCSVWKGSYEIAEMKAYQLRASGPDPRRIAAGARRLEVTIEPSR